MKLRIATFNIENLDDNPEQSPSLDDRMMVLRPQLRRLDADVICFQEIHSQQKVSGDRELRALTKLIESTPYSDYKRAHSKTEGRPYAKRNLVILSRFQIAEVDQYRSSLLKKFKYQKVTAKPEETEAKKISFERPILYTKIQIHNGFHIHLITVHLKSRIPTDIPGQQKPNKDYIWLSSSGWAEGFFLSSLKRVAQALEMRILVDKLFDEDSNANIIVCGDFNAHPDEVPVEAITGRIENTSNPLLVPRVLTPCSNTIPATARYTYLHQGQKRLLDHMLISRNMLNHYQKAEIHNETLHDEGVAFAYDEKFPESDHAPFVVQFEIPNI